MAIMKGHLFSYRYIGGNKTRLEILRIGKFVWLQITWGEGITHNKVTVNT